MRKILLLALTWCLLTVNAEEKMSGEKVIKLPAPQKSGGMPLLNALAQRKSLREFATDKKFTPQQLADLLWAASGISREDGRLTAPTARNWQEIDLYVALDSGVYFYNRKENSLELKLAEDIRKATGMQDFVGVGTIEIICVCDGEKMRGAKPDDIRTYAYIDSGYISQNIYLFAASENLATVVRGMVPRKEVEKLLQLKETQFVTVVQTVGFQK